MQQATEMKNDYPDSVQEVRITPGITPDDVETILNMAAASGLFSSDVMMTAEDMAWESAYGDGNESQTFLKATTNESGQEKTVGYLCYGPIPYWPESFEMYGIAVEPAFQRLGIGSALLSEMHRQIALGGGKHIFLETGLDRSFENSRLFYEANDFTQEHRYLRQFVPSEGGVVYRCDIDSVRTGDQYQ